MSRTALQELRTVGCHHEPRITGMTKHELLWFDEYSHMSKIELLCRLCRLLTELDEERARVLELERMYESVLACNVELNARLYGGGN